MNEQQLREGFKELNELASIEYRESLEDIFQESDAQKASQRLGRLVGVILKEPFASSTNLDSPTYVSEAYRSWELNDSQAFECQQTTWQYQALEQIQSDLALGDMTVYQFASAAHYERGFFGFLARDVCKYICGDKAIRAKVAAALTGAGAVAGKLPAVTPEGIVGAGGLSLGVLLIQSVPVLGMVGAPVIAALIVILYRLGIEAFCNWSASAETEKS